MYIYIYIYVEFWVQGLPEPQGGLRGSGADPSLPLWSHGRGKRGPREDLGPMGSHESHESHGSPWVSVCLMGPMGLWSRMGPRGPMGSMFFFHWPHEAPSAGIIPSPLAMLFFELCCGVLGPRSWGQGFNHGPMGSWAHRAKVSMSPMGPADTMSGPMVPWARAHGPKGPGPWAQGLGPIP